MNNLKDIHNVLSISDWGNSLFCQDFNEQFEGYTQHWSGSLPTVTGCFVRISMNNLKDIHNKEVVNYRDSTVVLSGFQWTIWRIYTTDDYDTPIIWGCFVRISMNNLKDIHNHQKKARSIWTVVLSGFQWTIWRIYTTKDRRGLYLYALFCQDFNEQFEGYTQQSSKRI